MTEGTSVILLAHADAAKVRRLLAALAGLEVLLHCDRHTAAGVFAEMTRDPGPLVRVLPRSPAHLSSWSLAEVEYRALRVWLETSRAERVILASGACYPLVSVGDLCAELETFKGLTRMPLDALPFRPWDTARNRDGGLWRVRRRFVTFRGRVIRVGGVPLRTFKRRPPAGLELRASSQFKVYARRHVAALLRVLAERPDIVRFWRTTLVPNEMCAASILASPDLVGDICDEICDDQPWYIDWGQGPRYDHPRWLTMDDLPALAAARAALPRPAERLVADRDGYRKLFARKIPSSEMELLDAIDATLRVDRIAPAPGWAAPAAVVQV